MNLKTVLKTYSLLRQLSDDESALLATLRAMNDAERELLVESLVPATVKKPATKHQRKVEHCAACDYTKRAAVHKDTMLSDYHEFQSSKPKSARASGMAETLNKNLSAQRQASLDDTEEGEGQSLARCGKKDCNAWAVNPIHDPSMGYAGYHEFQPQRAAAVGAGIQSTDIGPLP